MTYQRAFGQAPVRRSKPAARPTAGLLEPLEPRVLLTTYAVTTTADSGPGSLRQAILDADANPGADAVTFAIPGAAPFTISPTSPLPAITETLSVDGTTQSGFDPATHAPVVAINGNGGGGWSGLYFSGSGADGSSVRGLQITVERDIVLDGASHCVVAGNYLGTDGSHPPVYPPDGPGVYLAGSASYNLIGGTTAADRNVISGTTDGVSIVCNGTDNAVQGNYIGTDASGTFAIPNSHAGIFVELGSNTLIGGTNPGEGNVISGSVQNNQLIDGIDVKGGAGTVIVGNSIGTDASGTVALHNPYGYVAITIEPSAAGTVVGGTSQADRNVIAGTFYDYASNCVIQGNYIGIDATGTKALGGGPVVGSLAVTYGTNVLVGGTAPGAGNVIYTLYIDAANSTVQSNFVGTDATGRTAIGNAGRGVYLGGSGITFGGTSPAARNVISGNNGPGILLANGTKDTIEGNFIGANAAGSPLPNQGDGITIQGTSTGNQIGGTAAGAGNLIAFNTGAGVAVVGYDSATTSPFASGNSILSNSIDSNGGLGIDLSPTTTGDGVTPNDPGDADAGPNDLQNFPVLASAVTGGGVTRVAGSLNSTPSSSFLLQFFSSPAADPSGFGEGRTYLGSLPVITDASGNASFSTDLLASVPPGQVVAATATALTAASAPGDTSEFSRAVTVTQAAAAVNGGAAQRSTVTSLTARFNRPVALGPGALTLSRLTTDSTGAVTSTTDVSSAVTWSSPDGGATWVASVVAGGPADGGGGSLSDGVYRLTLHPAAVTDAATGAPLTGGDEVLTTFHRLFGDADGNGTVNAADYARFKSAFGTSAGASGYNPAFDADGNGTINALDLTQFKKRFGTSFTYT